MPSPTPPGEDNGSRRRRRHSSGFSGRNASCRGNQAQWPQEEESARQLSSWFTALAGEPMGHESLATGWVRSILGDRIHVLLLFITALHRVTPDTQAFVPRARCLIHQTHLVSFLLSALRTRQWLRWRLLLCQLINTCG